MAWRRPPLRSLIRPVVDPWHGWLGAAGEVDRRVVRYGSCEFRSMDGAHGLRNPIGYPAVAVEALADGHGIATAWQNVFCIDFESLPQHPAALLQHYRLGGPADVVVVQIGAVYAVTNALGDRQAVINLRDQLSHRAPAGLVGAHYAALDLLLAKVGRVARPYGGPAGFDSFVDAVRATWPRAHVLVELPYLPVADGAWRRGLMEEVRSDLVRAAIGRGIEVVDHDPRLDTSGPVRCRNGYNLNTNGSAVVGAVWAARLAELWVPGSATEAEPRRLRDAACTPRARAASSVRR